MKPVRIRKGDLFLASPSIWFRYVDDTFSLFDNIKASRFLHYLNNRHLNIKFTMELEENQEVPLLGVLTKHHQNTFSTTVHRKKTFTGLYTKWYSFTPRKYKINLYVICTFTLWLFSHLFDILFNTGCSL